MNEDKLKSALLAIELALASIDNCVATDLPAAEPDENSWRVDHKRELAHLEAIKRHIGISTDTCP